MEKNLNTGNDGDRIKRTKVYPQSYIITGFRYQILPENSRFCQQPLSNVFSTQRKTNLGSMNTVATLIQLILFNNF